MTQAGSILQQLKPGSYSVTVEAQGFDVGQNNNVISGLGQKQTVDFTLKVARSDATCKSGRKWSTPIRFIARWREVPPNRSKILSR